MTFYDATPIDWIELGGTATVAVDGFPVAVANVEGQFYAFQNLCPHQGTTLGGRSLEEGCNIVCPQHSSKYDVRTGRYLEPASLDGFQSGSHDVRDPRR